MDIHACLRAELITTLCMCHRVSTILNIKCVTVYVTHFTQYASNYHRRCRQLQKQQQQ